MTDSQSLGHGRQSGGPWTEPEPAERDTIAAQESETEQDTDVAKRPCNTRLCRLRSGVSDLTAKFLPVLEQIGWRDSSVPDRERNRRDAPAPCKALCREPIGLCFGPP